MRTFQAARRQPVLGFIAFLFFLAFTLTGCLTEPITGRMQLALISEAEANTMGAQSYTQLLSQAKVGGTTTQNSTVERVGNRIARVTDARLAQEGREPYQWEFKVIADDKTANAFALPGGKVAVYTGILPITQDEPGLAVVMGHEVAHAYCQHGRTRVSQQVVGQYGLEAVQLALGGDKMSDLSKMTMAALGVGVQVGSLKFSREDESAADHVGLMLMAEAGYDPRSAVAFWQRMEQAGGGASIEFLSTHPSHETRIEDLKKLVPDAIQVYEKSKVAPVK